MNEPPPDPRVPLEPLGPLSGSLVWQLQRLRYEEEGPGAWGSGSLPYHATSNPTWVDACAGVVLGYLRDCQARDDFDPGEPVTAVELGAGHGRFGYGLVQRVLERVERSRLRGMRFRYVLTDLAEANVAAWERHPRLAPLLEAGVVDLARFDATTDEAIHLRVSGDVLRAGSCANPGVVVANYVFDSIPQDIVAVEDGEVVAVHVAVTSTQEEPDLHDPRLEERLGLAHGRAAFDPTPFDPVTLGMLEHLREGPDVAALLLPSVALGCIARLQRIWDDRLLLLVGDKGPTTERDQRDQELPGLVRHGSVFSLSVDHHFIAAWFAEQGGRSMLVPRFSPLHLTASIVGFEAAGSIETEGAYWFEIEERNPADFVASTADREPVNGVEPFLALLRASGYDPMVFMTQIAAVSHLLRKLDDVEREQMRDALEETWSRFFPIHEPLDVAYYLAYAHHELGDLPRAITMLEQSIAIHGPTGPAVQQLAICWFESGDLDRAEAVARRAAEFPAAEDATELLAAIAEARLSETSG